MRESVTALCVVAVTLVVGGCSQTASPAGPSASAAAVGSAVVQGPPIMPLLAQLTQVDNHIVSANHQLTLFLIPPNPVIPGNPVHPQNALNFYVKANDVLDAVALNGPPIAPPAQWNAALNAIVGRANTTVQLLLSCDGCIGGPPIFPQALHTIEAATSLMSF